MSEYDKYDSYNYLSPARQIRRRGGAMRGNENMYDSQATRAHELLDQYKRVVDLAEHLGELDDSLRVKRACATPVPSIVVPIYLVACSGHP
ncbi:Uu.00g110500.m01.CDS01 [Anthostomella pinea]|uniref:Uu.00g110500.m01.CDS01 n=1 Tax=Anthostomella pinea TaxID=933095 RepID=A0AAI8VEZ7_9PEZI|nr:Uu.00g110500.m01.CDS01 [Anthostomella pinea]